MKEGVPVLGGIERDEAAVALSGLHCRIDHDPHEIRLKRTAHVKPINGAVHAQKCGLHNFLRQSAIMRDQVCGAHRTHLMSFD